MWLPRERTSHGISTQLVYKASGCPRLVVFFHSRTRNTHASVFLLCAARSLCFSFPPYCVGFFFPAFVAVSAILLKLSQLCGLRFLAFSRAYIMSSHFGGFSAGQFAAPADELVFPHLQDFDDADFRLDTDVYWRAPWFWPAAINDLSLIEQYASSGVLPGNLPVDVVKSPNWKRRCVVPTSDLINRNQVPQNILRSRFAKLCYQRFFRNPGRSPVPSSLDLDVHWFRTESEVEYGYHLAELDIGQWLGQYRPCLAALCFTRPILRAEFRYVRKYEVAPDYWERVKWERRSRARHGYYIPLQYIEVDMIREHARYGRYVPFHHQWHEYETPMGFLVDLPPVITYRGIELASSATNSGLWVVFYSEWIAKCAAALLWDAYDHFRVWCLPKAVCAGIRELDLSDALGSVNNYHDALHLVSVIESIDWHAVPANQRSRTRTFRHDVGRSAAAGDYILYDPWRRMQLDNHDAAVEAYHNSPEMPEDHPIGYVFADQGAWNSNMEEDTAPNGDETQALAVNEEDVVRQFLQSAGVASNRIDGDVAYMREYLRGVLERAGEGSGSPEAGGALVTAAQLEVAEEQAHFGDPQ